MPSTWNTLAIVAASTAAALVVSTSALAGSDASGNPLRTTLGPGTWSGPVTALYPGAPNDTERLPFTITNDGATSWRLAYAIATIRSGSGGDSETAAGADIVGCRSAWFTVSIPASDHVLPAELAPGASYTGEVDLTMQDSGSDQDLCQRSAPAVTVTAG